MSSRTSRRTVFLCAAFFAVLSLVLSMSGQSAGGRVIGKVSDSTGAVVSGVNVKLTNVATGVARESKTSDSGEYTFVEVAPGNYRAEYTLQGFKKYLRDNI